MATVDEALLTRLRRYEDRAVSVGEEFLPSALGPEEAVGVLSRPLGKSRSVGWILCPSLGKERGYLRRLEAHAARRLASEGFPVLRIRSRHVEPFAATKDLSLSLRLAEVEEAAAELVERAGVAQVGALGALGGGAVAAIACERFHLSLLAMWEPVVRGKQYLKDAFRMQSVSALVAGEDGGRPVPTRRALEELSEQGWTMVRGFRLAREAHDEIEAVDLTQTMEAFRGRSLIVGVSPTGEPSSRLRRLSAHLEEIGGSPTLMALQDPLVAPFGECYFRDEGLIRVDARLALDRRLTDVVAEWAKGGSGQPASQAA